LFEDWALSLAANLAGPVLDAGRRQTEVERRRAVEQQRLYAYGQAVLEALRDVEDALALEAARRDQLAHLEEQLHLSAETLDQLRLAYRNGAVNFLDVLTAQTDHQQLQREHIAARRDRVESRIALYRALAGGFEMERESP